jgi:glycosyltransferase involved in cell wall biosynthesis
MDNQNNKPLVSIAIPVYNHERYIVKAIESVLMQKTDFEFEIVVGDDYSSDTTRKLLLDLKEKYSDKITLILSDKNNGVNNNARNIFHNCQGKYIAMLEGDDYWVFENKLQMQIDFLEQNEDYVGCFHDAIISTECEENNNQQNQSYCGYRAYSQINKYYKDFHSWDIIERNIIPTASLVFRNKMNIPDFFIKFADITLSLTWAFQIFIIGDGKFRYFNEAWSVYNDHPHGVSKTESLNSFKLSNIKVLKRFAKEKHLKYMRNSIFRTITSEYRQILVNPNIILAKKSYFFKILAFYFYYYFVTFRFEFKNIFDYRKNLKLN